MSDVIAKILRLAERYPSGDNCQPFYLVPRGDHRFEIHHDSERARHIMNFNNDCSYLTLGILFSHLEAAAAQYHLSCRLQLTKGSASPSFWAEVEFKEQKDAAPAAATDLLTAQGLASRYTERRPFPHQAPVPKDFASWLHLENQRHQDFLLWRVNPSGWPNLVPTMLELERNYWRCEPAFADLMKWFRLSQKEAQVTQDGMDLKSLGVPRLGLLFLQLIRKDIRYFRLFKDLGLVRDQVKAVRQGLLSSSLFAVAFTRELSSPEDLCRVGQSYGSAWLTLAGLNWGFQPVTLATLLASQARRGLLPPPLKPLEASAIRVNQALCAGFQSPPGWLPAWGFRAGPVAGLTPLPPTLRRPLLRP